MYDGIMAVKQPAYGDLLMALVETTIEHRPLVVGVELAYIRTSSDKRNQRRQLSRAGVGVPRQQGREDGGQQKGALRQTSST